MGWGITLLRARTKEWRFGWVTSDRRGKPHRAGVDGAVQIPRPSTAKMSQERLPILGKAFIVMGRQLEQTPT